MRIDYSEPRRSPISSPGHVNLRSSGNSGGSTMAIAATVIGLFLFAAGFATGWHFSQKSAKKAFRAAMEQQSLENAPKEEKKSAIQPQNPIGSPVTGVPTASTVSQGQLPNQQAATQPAGAATAPSGQPLTFYKNLPNGQKSTVLGSGINDKTKTVVQPTTPPQSTQQAGSQPTTKPSEQAANQPKPSPHTGGYVVQVASYRSQDEAKKLKKELGEKGYTDISVSEISLNDNGTWFRVRIGRHLEKEAATKIANKLMSSAKVLPDQD